MVPTASCEAELARWLAPFRERLGRAERRHWAPLYLRGLLLPGERKSIEPLAERVQNLLQGSRRPQRGTHEVVKLLHVAGAFEKADRLVGGREAVLLIDDTALVKQVRHSVGVARQYCGELGKRANCQSLVTLTLARGEVPVPVWMRLFLPESWAEDAERCQQAGRDRGSRAPLQAEVGYRAGGGRCRARGRCSFGCVSADAEYGKAAEGLWLMCEWSASGEKKYSLCNPPRGLRSRRWCARSP